MPSYLVAGYDGQLYGPADEQMLADWMREGRIQPSSPIVTADTRQPVMPQSIPTLAPIVGLSQPMVNTLVQPAYPMLAYARHETGPSAHLLRSFSTPVVVLLHFVTLGIFSMIHFMLMHGKMPMLRRDDPSAGKAVGFMFIPLFNIYWHFFGYLRLIDRINEQRRFAGLRDCELKGLFITSAVLMFIPFANYVSALILCPIFYGNLQSSVNELVRVTRGPMA